jgi:hypothetical protein
MHKKTNSKTTDKGTHNKLYFMGLNYKDVSWTELALDYYRWPGLILAMSGCCLSLLSSTCDYCFFLM